MNVGNEPVIEENKRIRRLRIVSDMLVQTLSAGGLTWSQAERMIHEVRLLAVEMFPGKEHTFDLIYMPKFRRALRQGGLSDQRQALKVLSGGKNDVNPNNEAKSVK